eukprot:454383-Rhodomonas_salina.1
MACPVLTALPAYATAAARPVLTVLLAYATDMAGSVLTVLLAYATATAGRVLPVLSLRHRYSMPSADSPVDSDVYTCGSDCWHMRLGRGQG